MKKTLLSLAVATLGLTTGKAFDTVYTFNLDTAQEAFHNDDPTGAPDRSGSGRATFRLSDTSGAWTLSYTLYFDGLSGNSTEAHIHGLAAPGSDGPLLAYFEGAWGMSTGGGFSSSILNQDEVDQFYSGLLYVDVHSTTFPSGEIRAQIVPVPEPGTTALIVAAGGLMMRVLHRNRS